jgi:hypothetical protein
MVRFINCWWNLNVKSDTWRYSCDYRSDIRRFYPMIELISNQRFVVDDLHVLFLVDLKSSCRGYILLRSLICCCCHLCWRKSILTHSISLSSLIIHLKNQLKYDRVIFFFDGAVVVVDLQFVCFCRRTFHMTLIDFQTIQTTFIDVFK